jgi:hypothetical protein
MRAHKKRRQGQRSTTGIRPGEKASDYQRLTIRLPEDVRDELEALSQELHLPQWRVIVDAIQAYRASHTQAKVGRGTHV